MFRSSSPHTPPRRTAFKAALTVAAALLGLGGLQAGAGAVRDGGGAPAAPAAEPTHGEDVHGGDVDAEDADGDHHHVHPLTAVPKSDSSRGLVYRGLQLARTGPCVGGLRTAAAGVCTHGPDAAPTGADIHRTVPPVAGGSGVRRSTNSVACEGDGVAGNRAQVLYVHGQGSANRYSTYLTSFRTWAEGIDTIYSESAKETGGVRHVRFVTTTCQVSVTDVEIAASALNEFGATIQALAAKGFNRADRKYVIFADASVYCGIGGFAGDDRATADNRSNFGPSYGRSDTGCWSAATAAHELGHNLGAVNYSAPHTSRGAHCIDEWDVMCYSDTPYHPSMQYVCSEISHDTRLDCHHDDYYNTNPSTGSYLATHWNVANSVFLVKGDLGTTADTTRPAAPPGLTATGVTASGATLSWRAATDNVGVTAYDVYAGTTQLATTTGLTFAVTGLKPATSYTFAVKARDAAGNISPASSTVRVETLYAAPVSGQTYQIVSVGSATAVEVLKSSLDEDAPIGLLAKAARASQRWTAVSGGGGTLSFRSVASGKCLAIHGGALAAGAYAVQVTCAAASAQLWAPAVNTAGVTLTARHSGLVLGASSWQFENNRLVGQQPNVAGNRNLNWIFQPVG